MDLAGQSRAERIAVWRERGAPDDCSAEAAARLHDVMSGLSEDAYFASWLYGLSERLEPLVRAAIAGGPVPEESIHDGVGRDPAAVLDEFAEIVAIVREHRIWLAESQDGDGAGVGVLDVVTWDG